MKIRYRLVYNYSNRLNKDGRAPVAVEARQGKKKIYISTQVLLCPHQWQSGMVVNHPNANKLTVYLNKRKNEIEEIELDALYKGKHLTLRQLKEAVKSGLRSNALLSEFVESAIGESYRGKNTKQSYKYLVNDLDKLFGKITINDITYDLIEKYKAYMYKQKLSENTIKGKLKLLRCVVNEALKRNLVTEDPFKFITIGNMTAREGYLTLKEVENIEKLKLKEIEGKVRDLFLLGCYTGLRISDLLSLEEATIEDGVMHKRMHKTNLWVHIPVDTIFWGKAKRILEKYPNIKRLSYACSAATANKIIKKIAKEANIEKRVYFHLARKTFSNALQSLGVNQKDISRLLGHKEIRVTERHYLFDNPEHLQTIVSDIFQNKSNKKKKRE